MEMNSEQTHAQQEKVILDVQQEKDNGDVQKEKDPQQS